MITRSGAGPRMSAGVRFGDVIWLAGTVSADRSLGVRGQTAAILERISERLAELGSDKTRILMANVWLADIATFDEMNAAWDAWVDPAHLPARATVEARLASPDYLVEIAVVAAALPTGA
jgi:enamine deaminase RidA (YjgF/YER057c/UK114 family)